jgi:hypothetical protein
LQVLCYGYGCTVWISRANASNKQEAENIARWMFPELHGESNGTGWQFHQSDSSARVKAARR